MWTLSAAGRRRRDVIFRGAAAGAAVGLSGRCRWEEGSHPSDYVTGRRRRCRHPNGLWEGWAAGTSPGALGWPALATRGLSEALCRIDFGSSRPHGPHGRRLSALGESHCGGERKEEGGRKGSQIPRPAVVAHLTTYIGPHLTGVESPAVSNPPHSAAGAPPPEAQRRRILANTAGIV